MRETGTEVDTDVDGVIDGVIGDDTGSIGDDTDDTGTVNEVDTTIGSTNCGCSEGGCAAGIGFVTCSLVDMPVACVWTNDTCGVTPGVDADTCVKLTIGDPDGTVVAIDTSGTGSGITGGCTCGVMGGTGNNGCDILAHDE